MIFRTESQSDFLRPQDPLFFGRRKVEYEKMFALKLSELKNKKILDCSSGPTSFISETRPLGLNVIGCDPMYSRSKIDLSNIGNESIKKFIEILSFFPEEKLSRKFYSSIDEIEEAGKTALEFFLNDYEIGRKENRYIDAALPFLPFENNTFDLVLCGHFFFVYSDTVSDNYKDLNYEFHLNSALELLRISKQELRLFPIPHKNGDLRKGGYAERLLTDLKTKGIQAILQFVDYAIPKDGGDLLLILRKVNP